MVAHMVKKHDALIDPADRIPEALFYVLRQGGEEAIGGVPVPGVAAVPYDIALRHPRKNPVAIRTREGREFPEFHDSCLQSPVLRRNTDLDLKLLIIEAVSACLRL